MERILEFIARHFSFLWNDAKLRISNSEVTTAFGDDAWLIAESDWLRLRFVSDRGQLFLDLQPSTVVMGQDEWYSVDLVRRMLQGSIESTALLDESYAVFLRDRLGELEECFSPAKWSSTRKELRRLMDLRANELFG